MYYIIYHRTDFDGICSAKITEKFLKKVQDDPEIEMVGWDYGDPLPILDINKDNDDRVIVVDLSMTPEFMERLVKLNVLIWIDHHVSAAEKLKDIEGIENVLGLRENGKGACELCWNYFFDESTLPEAVRLISCYDVWNHKDERYDWNEDIEPFYYGLKAISDSVKDFPEDLLGGLVDTIEQDDIREIIQKGREILRYEQSMYPEYNQFAFEVEIDGFKLLALNSAHRGSAVLVPIFNPEKQDGMMIFKYDGKHDEWRYGFYTEKEGIDLSPIAIKRGGGGHKMACGLETKELLPELKAILIK